MIITHSFVMRLAKMNDEERSVFIHANREALNFSSLCNKLKQMVDEAMERTEIILAEKLLDIKADICLYHQHQLHPAAVSDVELIKPFADKENVVACS